MHLCGDGSFVSTADAIGVTLNKHIRINAGYQLASHLTVNGTQNRLSLQLSQRARPSEWNFRFR
jgi:hypothetical protein